MNGKQAKRIRKRVFGVVKNFDPLDYKDIIREKVIFTKDDKNFTIPTVQRVLISSCFRKTYQETKNQYKFFRKKGL